MNTSLRTQLMLLDRALLDLANERERLVTDNDPGQGQSGQAQGSSDRECAAVEDLVRRQKGPLSADRIRRLFAVLDDAKTSQTEASS